MQHLISRCLALFLVALIFGAGGYFAWQAAQVPPKHERRLEPTEFIGAPLSARRPALPPPANWLPMDTGQGFRFFAPFGTGHDRLQGEDSKVGRIAGPGFRLEYDFGLYSNTLEGAKEELDYSEDHIVVDGRRAIVRRARLRQPDRGYRYFVGLFVPQAVWSPSGGLDGSWQILEIHGTAVSEEDRRIVERLFSSVLFDTPLPVVFERRPPELER